jgi:hypothetical protein
VTGVSNQVSNNRRRHRWTQADNLYLTCTSTTAASGTATLDIKGGFLYATIATTNNGQTFSGKVTGATGTVAAKAINATGTGAVVTITYSTKNGQG